MKKPILFSCFLFTLFSVYSQQPTGAVGVYPLDNNSIDDISGNALHGYNYGATSTTNRFGASSKAISLQAHISLAALPYTAVEAVQNNFSLGFWINTNMTASGGPGVAWYGGTSLIDAEMCGQTTDWGFAMYNGGGICFGIGSPDLTIHSTNTNYNDGNWHFVMGVRDQVNGTITLYIDGSIVATTSGTTTGPLNAPYEILLGGNPCSYYPYFTGSMDDIIMYDRVLTATEVAQLHSFMIAVTLPVRWISFTGQRVQENVSLSWEVDQAINNNRFEVEHSLNGTNFVQVSTVSASAGTTTLTGALKYDLTIPANGNSAHYFRIKQVDHDEKFMYSSVVRITRKENLSGIYLQSNMITDRITLQNPDNFYVGNVDLIDVSGRIHSSISLNSNASSIYIPANKLARGIYFVKISGVNGITETIRILKN